MERNAPLGSREHYGLATNTIRHVVPFIGEATANVGRGIRNLMTDFVSSETLTPIADSVI